MKTAQDYLDDANAVVPKMDAKDAIAKHAEGKGVFIDVRDSGDIAKSGTIKGAHRVPRGMIEFWVDPDSPYFKEIFGQDKTFVFHCASGWRSAITTATLQDMGFDAAHLREGFSTWEKHGGPVEYPEKKD